MAHGRRGCGGTISKTGIPIQGFLYKNPDRDYILIATQFRESYVKYRTAINSRDPNEG